MIAFLDKRNNKWFANWNPNIRGPYYFDPKDASNVIRLFPKASEAVTRITYNLDENWMAVEVPCTIFSDLARKQKANEK